MSNKLSVPENLGISKHLHAFLVDWLAWATADKVVNRAPYRTHMGLCSSLMDWLETEEVSIETGENTVKELTNLFGVTCDYDGRINYPFGYNSYYTRRSDGTQHKDPARLEWVRKMITFPIVKETSDEQIRE